MPLLTNLVVILALAALMLADWTINIAKEYERGVVFRLGRLIALKGVGCFRSSRSGSTA